MGDIIDFPISDERIMKKILESKEYKEAMSSFKKKGGFKKFNPRQIATAFYIYGVMVGNPEVNNAEDV